MKTELTPQQRTKFRKMFGVEQNTNIPVMLLPCSMEEPKIVGKSGGYYTKTGIKIRHPNAYAKKGRSSMIYHRTTRKILVGENWFHANFN
jgi:hypothetical protein